MMDFRKEFNDNLKKVIEKELQLQNYEIVFAGNTKFGQGFMGDILYATITNKTSNEKIDIVIKSSLPSKIIREKTPNSKMFIREIKFYSELLKEFKKFQDDKNVEEPFISVPKFYGGAVSGNNEILVLENVTSRGFKVLPKNLAFTLNQTKLILEEFGKFHAFSFAMKDQKPELFEELNKYRENLYAEFSYKSGFIQLLKGNFRKSIELLKGVVSDATLKRYQSIEDRFDDIIKNICNVDPEYSVICHGDCWGTNYMFKFDSDTLDQSSISAVCILDWQLARFSPPAVDLANFLLTTSPSSHYPHLPSLLDHYHDSLSAHLRRLGSDPEKLFPRQKLQQQWDRCKDFGVCLAPVMVKFCLFKIPEDAKEVEKMTEGDPLKKMLIDPQLDDVEEWRERLKGIAECFFGDDKL